MKLKTAQRIVEIYREVCAAFPDKSDAWHDGVTAERVTDELGFECEPYQVCEALIKTGDAVPVETAK